MPTRPGNCYPKAEAHTGGRMPENIPGLLKSGASGFLSASILASVKPAALESSFIPSASSVGAPRYLVFVVVGVLVQSYPVSPYPAVRSSEFGILALPYLLSAPLGTLLLPERCFLRFCIHQYATRRFASSSP